MRSRMSSSLPPSLPLFTLLYPLDYALTFGGGARFWPYGSILYNSLSLLLLLLFSLPPPSNPQEHYVIVRAVGNSNVVV